MTRHDSYPEFDRIRTLFDAALARPASERQAFLAAAAGDDLRLRDEVLALLTEADAATVGLRDESLRGAPADESTAPVTPSATDELLQLLGTGAGLDARRFVPERELGEGGMGKVVGLHDRYLNRRLAMKVQRERSWSADPDDQRLAKDLLARFLEEAQITSQLDHPGVVPVHDLGLDANGKVWFTMRRVNGRTADEVFADAFARRDGWSLTRGLEVILKVCDTMSYAHEKGVLHRDLKPRNVMVGRFGEVYVMDWGLAKVVGQDDRHDLRIRPATAAPSARVDTTRKRDAEVDADSPCVTMDGVQLGTPSYMSPEQALGQGLDMRADVYAIGSMIYELVTGTAPYAVPGLKKSPRRVLEDVVLGPPRRIEELVHGAPAELVAIVDKATARDREQRYASAAALAADVRAFLGSQVVSAYRTGALVELRLWVKRNRPLAASLAAAVLILVAGIVGTSWLARANGALARQKTELAAAETRAKDDALRQKQRADEAAATNEKLARERTALAQSESEAKVAATKLADEKGRTVANFNQLSAVVRLEDALAKQDTLWPAWPEQVAALQAWLENDCAQLLSQRPQIEATIAELRSKAVPLTPEQVEADRRAAPQWPAFRRQQQIVAALQRAQTIRAGTTKLELPELPAALRDADASALNSFAWPRVAPEKPEGEPPQRTTFGEEAAALVAARAAVAKASGQPDEFQFLDTLAWAALANGQDAEARQRTAEALAKAPNQQRDAYAGYQRDIEAAIAAAPARIAAAEARRAEIEAKVSTRRTWTFGAYEESRSAEFLHNTLVDVLARLNSMATKEKLDVEQRLSWARQVRAASLDQPQARARWTAAREAIAKADGVVASALYAGRDIKLADDAVIGLVPIGMNPVTKLWEFYDLRSAWDGSIDPGSISIPLFMTDGERAGNIEVKDETGIVFVLLPGGTFTMGSQSSDPNAANYDPQRDNPEALHEVRLAPFFLARHELTQGQWRRLTGRTPSYYAAGKDNHVGGRITWTHPVEQVDWWTSDRWLTWYGLLLPTEAQWEYACRAGTNTPWSCAPRDLEHHANVADATAVRRMQWPCESWTDRHLVHAPVGTFVPNGFGLFDVHGNVWEWTRDGNHGLGARPRPGDGLRGDPKSSPLRLARGGSFSNPARNARSALRNGMTPGICDSGLGVRPARILRQVN